MKKTELLCFLCVTVVGFAHSVSVSSAGTLTEAVAMALKTNPEVLAAKTNAQAVEQQIIQAYAAYLPTIDLTMGYGREVSDNTTSRSVFGNDDHHLTLNRGESGILVNQMLFDGFGTSHNIVRARALVESSQYELNSTLDRISLSAVEAYLEVARKHELLELVKDNVLLHQRILAKVRAKYEAGGSDQADMRQTVSRLSLSMANHASSQGAFRTTRYRFVRIVGMLPKTWSRPTLSDNQLPESLDLAIKQSLKSNPTILTAQFALRSAKAEKEQTKAGFWPRIDLELGYNNNANVGGSAEHSNNALAMLRLRYNLYRGGTDLSRSRELGKRVDQRVELLENLRRTTRENIEIAWESINTSRERMKFLHKHVAVSQGVTTAYHDQFRMGKRTWLDVLNAENELFNAKTALVNETFNFLWASYQLLASMGTLRDSLAKDSSMVSEEPLIVTKPPLTNSPLGVDQSDKQRQLAASKIPKNILAQPKNVFDDPMIMMLVNETIGSASHDKGLEPQLYTNIEDSEGQDNPHTLLSIEERLWYVQVAAYSGPIGAGRILKKLQEKGYEAFVLEKISTNKDGYERPLWFVRIGGFMSYESAFQMKETLKIKENIDGLVVYPPPPQ